MKLFLRSAIYVAPLYGEGRGLKPCQRRCPTLGLGRSSLWRGAWIETSFTRATTTLRFVAPLYGEGRGLKLPDSKLDGTGQRVAPLYGEGRGLKHFDPKLNPWIDHVAPLSGEGRGLKPRRVSSASASCPSLLSMERGVD